MFTDFFFFFGRMNYSFNTVVSSSTFNNFRQNPKKSLAAFLGLKVHYIFIHRYTVYTQDTVYTQTLPYCLIDRYLPLIDVEGRLKKNTLNHYSKGFTNNKFTCMRKKKHRCQCSDRSRAVDACRHSEITSRAKALHTTRDGGDTFIVFIKRQISGETSFTLASIFPLST